MRHFLFAGLVLAWACAKDLPRFPDLTTDLQAIRLDSLQVTTTVSGYSDKIVIKEVGVLWGYDERQLTVDGAGVHRIPAPEAKVEAFTTLISSFPLDTIIYVRSYARIDCEGDFVVYSAVNAHSIGRVSLSSTYRIINYQVTAITNVSDKIQSFGYAWVNIDSVPGATLAAPHDSVLVGDLAESKSYTQLLSRLKPATRYLLRAQGAYNGRTLYGNTMEVFIGDVWRQMKNFTLAGDRWAPVAFTIDNKGFVGLGEELIEDDDTPQHGASMNDLWMYDQITDTWTRMADFPGKGRFWATAFVINGRAYVGAGRDSSQQFNDFYVYTPPPDNTWDTVAALPFTVRSAAGFSINGKGYLCGGYSNSYIPGNVINLNTLFEFDPAQNNGKGAWRQVVSFPGPGRKNMVSFVLNGKAYVGCGKDGFNDETISDGQPYNDFYCFDPLAGPSGGWTAIDPLPGGGRYDALAFSIGEYGFVGTGASSPYPTYKDLWRYKPSEGWIRKANVGPQNRRSSFAFVVNNQAFVGLGMLMSTVSTIDNDVWRYTPEKNKP